MTTEVCEDCIWWAGDGLGDRGECIEEDKGPSVLVGRYESCVSFLARQVDTYSDTGGGLLDDYD